MVKPAAAKGVKPRKLTFKETRELEGMEQAILAAEDEVERIEGDFMSPEFYKSHAAEAREIESRLRTANANVARLYARWEELEAVKAADAK